MRRVKQIKNTFSFERFTTGRKELNMNSVILFEVKNIVGFRNNTKEAGQSRALLELQVKVLLSVLPDLNIRTNELSPKLDCLSKFISVGVTSKQTQYI